MAIKDVLDFEGLSHFTEKIKTFVTDITSKLETNKANIASPTLTGTPKAPTATAGTNSTQIATTAFVQTAVSNLVDSAPETLDTLGEIADALKDNADIVDVLNDSIATKANTSDLTSHTSNTTVHITATERTNWNDANSKKHTHSNKSILDSTTASYTTADKTKLGGIATGAEVNQNAFSNVTVGSTTISADTTTDTLTLVAGSNVTITPDATNDKITISSSHPTISKSTNTTSTASPSAGGTFTAIDSITQDSNGHVTKFNTKTVTLPSTSITVDSALSSTSTNPVQNKVIYSNIAYNINGKKLYSDYDYENGMIGEYEGIGYSYPPATNTRFENLITQCIKGDMQKAKKTSVLSSVSECTASTTSTDIASASALAELNNSLNKIASTSVTNLHSYANTVWANNIEKRAGVAVLSLVTQIIADISAGTAITLCNIPEGFRPSTTYEQICMTKQGALYQLTCTVGGVVQIIPGENIVAQSIIILREVYLVSV